MIFQPFSKAFGFANIKSLYSEMSLKARLVFALTPKCNICSHFFPSIDQVDLSLIYYSERPVSNLSSTCAARINLPDLFNSSVSNADIPIMEVDRWVTMSRNQ